MYLGPTRTVPPKRSGGGVAVGATAGEERIPAATVSTTALRGLRSRGGGRRVLVGLENVPTEVRDR